MTTDKSYLRMSDWFENELVILFHFKTSKNVGVYYTTIHSKSYFHALYIASENETMHYFDFLNSKHPYMNITQGNVFLYVHVE